MRDKTTYVGASWAEPNLPPPQAQQRLGLIPESQTKLMLEEHVQLHDYSLLLSLLYHTFNSPNEFFFSFNQDKDQL